MFYRANRFNETKTETETNNISNTEKATGRAIDSSRPFPFPLKNVVFSNFVKPTNHRLNEDSHIIYASTPVQRTNNDN